MNAVDSKTHIREAGLYSTRYTKQSALVQESRRMLQKLSTGATIAELRDGVLGGVVIPQKSRNTRRHIWSAFTYRYLTDSPRWVLDDLVSAAHEPDGTRLMSLNYLYFCLRDQFTFDFVTRVVWPNRETPNFSLSRHDVMSFLDTASETQLRIRRWSTSTRSKLASAVLSGLRDFNVLQGVQRKRVSIPDLPALTAAHIVRLLISTGVKNNEVLDAPHWQLFLRNQDSIFELLGRDAASLGLKLDRVGSGIVVETPSQWSDFDAII